jgi:hypothetical protein
MAYTVVKAIMISTVFTYPWLFGVFLHVLLGCWEDRAEGVGA